MTLRPKLQRMLSSVDQVTEEFDRRMRSISELDLLARPDKNQWCIAEIIEHLNMVHAITFPRFFSILESAPLVGGERSVQIRYKMMDKIFVRAMSPGFPITLPVPPMFEPLISGTPKGVVLPRFRGLQSEFVRLIQEADDKQLAKLIVRSPANERIAFGFMAYLEGILLHEQYHWAQIVKRLG